LRSTFRRCNACINAISVTKIKNKEAWSSEHWNILCSLSFGKPNPLLSSDHKSRRKKTNWKFCFKKNISRQKGERREA